ncbi:cobalt-precorrin-6A reductase [Neorhizobium galegae]|uniref:cobalt-precorrin-6A reductase n=1 Tax=Neorhizobium galegae TaxID=399 RepID=UPI001AE5CA45|nr:cobalt-precorrin-6A reductase [Neorhizobium galegae]
MDNQGACATRAFSCSGAKVLHSILILGGTTEARQIAGRLAALHRFRLELSLAGRTKTPVEQPVPVRTGGFGGADGLAHYLAHQRIDLMIDATHPYAAQISANAATAARMADIPLVALRRPGWDRVPGDRWQEVESVEQAVANLGDAPRLVFLALGRQELLPFEAAPRHHYLVRSVDPVEPPLALADVRYITARGPFALDEEVALLRDNGIEVIVSKNSGGTASYGKIAAARALGLDVIMIRRPALPDVCSFQTVEALVDHVAQAFPADQLRGE